MGLTTGTTTQRDRTPKRLRCFICGQDTTDADDYVIVELTTDHNEAQQWFGAHATHLNNVAAPGFRTEIHLM